MIDLAASLVARLMALLAPAERPTELIPIPLRRDERRVALRFDRRI